LILVDRDKKIISEVSRWRGCLGRQIKIIGNFGSISATDRRLKKLVDEKLLTRKKYVYSLASIYEVTGKAKRLFELDTHTGTIRLDQAVHDIAVVDTYLFVKQTLKLLENAFTSEKEIRHKQGFVTRSHVPDFLFKHGNNLHCVEVELSEKSRERLEKNVADNFIKYSSQQWFVPKDNHRVKKWLEELKIKYPNIIIFDTDKVDSFIEKL